MPDATTRFPRYNLPQVFRVRGAVRAALEDFGPRPLAGADFSELVGRVALALPAAPRAAVEGSLRHYLGAALPPAEIPALAWRLAGNLPALRAGKPVLPWAARVDEWAPVQVLSGRWGLRRRRGGQAEPGFRFRIRVLAGGPAGLTFTAFWGRRLAGYVGRHVGFNRRLPLADPTELVQLRLLAHFEADRCRSGLWAGQFAATAGMVSTNRKLLRKRARLDFECPQKFTHECHRCPVGYRQCAAATHPLTYVTLDCGRCGQKRFHDPDPEWADPVCVGCRPAWEAALLKQGGTP